MMGGRRQSTPESISIAPGGRSSMPKESGVLKIQDSGPRESPLDRHYSWRHDQPPEPVAARDPRHRSGPGARKGDRRLRLRRPVQHGRRRLQGRGRRSLPAVPWSDNAATGCPVLARDRSGGQGRLERLGAAATGSGHGGAGVGLRSRRDEACEDGHRDREGRRRRHASRRRLEPG